MRGPRVKRRVWSLERVSIKGDIGGRGEAKIRLCADHVDGLEVCVIELS